MIKKTGNTQINYDAVLYAGLLKKFIKHIVWHEGITYTTDIKLQDSDAEFTEQDVEILQDIAREV